MKKQYFEKWDVTLVVDGHLGGYVVGGSAETYYPALWNWFRRNYRSVLDIGCGEGQSLKYFHDRGMRARGLEGSSQAHVDSPVASLMVQHDFTAGPYKTRETFDLVWCCEFVEHVEERFSDNFLETFALAKTVAMTHAVPGQEGHHHVNCQPAIYWINRMQSAGWTYQEKLSLFTRRLAGHGFYHGSGLVFTRESRLWTPSFIDRAYLQALEGKRFLQQLLSKRRKPKKQEPRE